jgi:hypothetical protein
MQPVGGAVTADRQPTIQVIATTSEGTRAALATAVPLAKGLAAKLVLIVPCIVPYAVDLDVPCESTTFFVRQYTTVIERLGGSATINVCLCRRLHDVVLKVVAARSTAVVGGPVGRWFTSPEERFANRLSVYGVPVVFAASGGNTTQRRAPAIAAALAALVLMSPTTFAQAPASEPLFSYGGFVDVGALVSTASPANHLFRNRGTTPRADELDVNMAAAYLRLAIQDGIFSSLIGYASLYAKRPVTPWI